MLKSPQKEEFELIPERAKIVKWIFSQAEKGIGKYRIASELNASKTPTWGSGPKNARRARKWHHSYVDKILNSPAVVGKFQPHRVQDGGRIPVGDIVDDYFPRVVSDATWERVKRHSDINQKRAGRVGSRVGNLFTHIAFCAQTGAPALYSDKGATCRYLKSDGMMPDGRKLKGWRYAEFEEFFLLSVGALDLAAIFHGPETAALETENDLAELQGRLREARQKMERITLALEDGGEIRALADRLRNLESEEDSLIKEERKLKARVAIERAAYEGSELTRKNLKKIIGEKDPRKRLLLRQEIRKVVSRIDIYFRVERTAQEQIEQSKFLERVKHLRRKGAKIFPMSPVNEARAIEITFINGIKRYVVEGDNGQPSVATDTTGAERVESGYMTFEPGVTRPIG